MTTSSLTVNVGGSQMEILTCTPAGNGPHPAILLAMHLPEHAGFQSGGFTEGVIERLAENGIASAVPFIFHRMPVDADMQDKRGMFDDKEILADTRAAMDYLVGRDDIDSSRIGIMGHCLGGRNSWLGAGHDDRYKVLVTCWGGSIWLGWGEGNPAPLDATGNLKCPVLGIFGNDDQNPSPDNVNDYEQALKDAGVDYEFHRYDGAGHAFQDFFRAERYREQQSEDAWGKILEFLKAKL